MKLIYTKKEVNKMNNYLQKLNINENLKKEINSYRESYPVSQELLYRIPKPDNLYYGDEIWNQAVTALLCGENILLVGHKATGKNIFAENLAAAFGRPKWDISFHVNMDAASLIGMDTFRNGEVTFRPGPVYSAAKSGGFATLDFRRTIDVPGYDRIDLHPATRFIATMNYGYSGTKELNEALVSRFAVIKMPMISKDNLIKLIQDKFETISEQAAEEFANVFLDLQKKCENSEISSKALDIRGLLDSIALMEKGLEVHTALDMGITNKSFDMYEQTLIKDTIGARISKKIKTEDLFKK